MLRFLLAWTSATASLVLLVWGVGGAASAQSSEDVRVIQAIKPYLRDLLVISGDKVYLSVIVIGPQGTQDQDSASGVDFIWTATGGTVSPSAESNTKIIYTAPDEAGTYAVTASAGSNCEGECTAMFFVTVRVAPSEPRIVPKLPILMPEIPSIFVDVEGNQYAVFTPEEGGTFNGGEFWVSAPSGVVLKGEYVGVRMFEEGEASNAGMTEHRYTLSGRQYAISTVDASGDRLASYRLDGPAQVCIPVPAELRPNITSVGLVVINDESTLTALTSWIRVTPSLIVCGNLSVVPAVVAASVPGSPPPLPTATPEPAPSLPVSGGKAPFPFAAIALALLLGIALVAAGTFCLRILGRDGFYRA